MKNQNIMFVVRLFCLIACCVAPTHAVDEVSLLPEPLTMDGEDSRTYINVPFETFDDSNGTVTATWPSEYEVTDIHIVADWEVVSGYAPGITVPLTADLDKRRYDFVARFKLINGEEFLGTTPIWCVRSRSSDVITEPPEYFVVTAPTEGCFGYSFGDGLYGCSATSSPDNCPELAVTCDGDSGSCSTCGNDNEACCKSKVTKVVVTGNGVVKTTVTHLELRRKCPKVEEQKPKGK